MGLPVSRRLHPCPAHEADGPVSADGRTALRPHEGKANAIILDHSGAVHRHGLPEDKVEWTLSPDDQATSPEHEKRQSSSEMKLTECSQCGALRKGGLPCPACGFLPKRPAEYVCFSDEDLVRVGASLSAR